MKLYSFERTQILPIDIEKAWKFFSSPNNLKIITPPQMGFKTKTVVADDDEIYAGLIITYKVKPLFGINLNWVTEITHVEKPIYFVDEQRFGPYSFWHHKHFFKEVEGGVEVRDLVHYALPFGFFGRMAHPIIVQQKLNEIFEFRHRKLEELFGKLY